MPSRVRPLAAGLAALALGTAVIVPAYAQPVPAGNGQSVVVGGGRSSKGGTATPAAGPLAETVVWSENFDAQADPTGFGKKAPAGWTVTSAGVNSGEPRWTGWTFTNIRDWTWAVGTDRRHWFTGAFNTFAVVESEHQRLAAGDRMTTGLTTPGIKVAGAKSYELRFDSHYAQGTAPQSAAVYARFDGGAPVELTRLTTDTLSSHEALTVKVPAKAKRVTFTFSYEKGFNDKWWGIDNVELAVPMGEPTGAPVAVFDALSDVHAPTEPGSKHYASAIKQLNAMPQKAGALLNRVRLQDAGVDTWILVADYQVIADRDGVGAIKERVRSLVTDYLSVGIDPEKSTIFAHSAVPALNQLMLPFLSLVTDSELRRNPTVKAEFEATGGRPMSGLLLTYPVHQAADILFCKANLVPVGKDQLPHLEQTRVIAQRFDKRYGRAGNGAQPVFPRADALLSEAPSVLGTDGQKMSKSRGNTIELRMTADETAKVLKKAVTDSERRITFDPVNRPEVSNLVMLAALATGREPAAVADEIGDGGSGALKKLVTEAVNEMLAPIRARRAEVEADGTIVREVLARGIEKANARAEATLDEVREAMQMSYDG